MSKIVKKVCMVGPEGVGKTSLVRRFVDNQFSEDYKKTIGVQISQKKINMGKENIAELILWDLEGYKIAGEYPSDYLLGAGAFVFVGDLSRENTLSEMVSIYQSINGRFQTDASMSFALNKSDLVGNDHKFDCLKTFQASGLITGEPVIATTSAKLGQRVDDLFYNIAQSFWKS